MKYIYFCISAVVVAMTMITACSEQPTELVFQDEITVFGYLRGGEAVDSSHAVLITSTMPITAFYELTEAAVTDAVVSITEQESGDVYQLVDDAVRPGYYSNENLMIRPGFTYRLEITHADKVVTAETTVPIPPVVTSDLDPETINVQSHSGLGERVPLYILHDNPDQLILFDLNCQEPYDSAEFIDPFFGNKYPRDKDSYDRGTDAQPKHIRALGRIREMGELDENGGLTVTWYSSTIVFYGRYVMQVVTIDDNYHDYMTHHTHQELYGGIVGGIGLFASFSGERYDLLIQK